MNWRRCPPSAKLLWNRTHPQAWTVPPSSALTSHHHTPDHLCRAAHDERRWPMKRTKPRGRAGVKRCQRRPPMSCLCQRSPRNAVTQPRRPNPASFSTGGLQSSTSPSLHLPSSSPRRLSQCFLRPFLSHPAQTSAPGWVEPFFRCRFRGYLQKEHREGRVCACVPAHCTDMPEMQQHHLGTNANSCCVLVAQIDTLHVHTT